MSQDLRRAFSNRTFQMALPDYLRLIARSWKLTASVMLFTVAATGAFAVLQPERYIATTEALVVPAFSANEIQAASGNMLARSKAKNYAALARTRVVALRAIEESGVVYTPEALLGNVKVDVQADGAVVRIEIVDTTADLAITMANTYLRVLTDQAREIEESAASYLVGNAVTIVPLAPAVLATAPITRQLDVLLPMSALVGLLIGLNAAMAKLHLDDRIRTTGDVEKLFSTAVLVRVPLDPTIAEVAGKAGGDRPPRRSKANATSQTAEAMRELRTNLMFVNVDSPPRVITVTSSVPSEGKSTVAANLAIAIAATGQRVVLIDGDLRRPAAAKILGLVAGAGVTDVLTRQTDVDNVLQPWSPNPKLSVLGSGCVPPNPSELLGSEAMLELVQGLADDAVVVIDAPPLLPVTDAAILASVSDGAVIVVRAGKTSFTQFAESLKRLSKSRARILGVVLNGVEAGVGAESIYYGEYLAYGSDSSSPGEFKA